MNWNWKEFPTVGWLDWLLDRFKTVLSVDMLRRLDALMTIVGGWGVYVVTILLFLVFLILGVRTGSVQTFIIAIAILPVGVLLHYVAIKMLGTVERLISSTPTSIRSRGYLNVVGMLGAIAGTILVVVGVIFGILWAVQSGDPSGFGIVLAGVFLVYLAAIALHPESIEVSIGDTTTIGQEAIGVLTFVIKSAYRFVPVLFGAGVVVAGVMAVIALIASVAANPIGAYLGAMTAAQIFVIVTLAPLVGYMLFLFFYLTIDVYRSILLLGDIKRGLVGGDAEPGGDTSPPPPPAPKSSGVSRTRKTTKSSTTKKAGKSSDSSGAGDAAS